MDDKGKNIVKRKLRKWGNPRLTKDQLKELRESIAQDTGHNKYASFKNLRKWVAQVKKEMKKEDSATKKTKTKKSDSTTSKKEVAATMALISDKVFIQTIGYEIAAIRRSMDRIGNQLTEIEKKLETKKESS